MDRQFANARRDNPPGSMPFMCANALTLLFALGHAGGVLQTTIMLRRSADAGADPKLEQLRELFARLEAYQTPKLLGLQASMLDLRSFFNIAFSVLLVAIFASNLAALRSTTERRAAVARLSVVHASSMLALAALSLMFNVAQGVVTATLITGLYIAAALRAKLAQPTIKSTSS